MRYLALLSLIACDIPSVSTIGGRVGNCDLEALDNEWPIGDGIHDAGKTGFNVGQILPDYALIDQNGDEVCGGQFAGRSQVIDFSAMLCVPCQKLACFARSAADDFGDAFVYTTVMSQNAQDSSATQEDAVSWANNFELYGPNTPVLVDYEGMGLALQAMGGNYEVPLLVVVDPGLRVKYRFEGSDDVELRAAIADVTGVKADAEGPSVCE